MDNFLNDKKRTSATNSDAEEAGVSVKTLKSDAEYSVTVIGQSSKKRKKNGTAPADVSQWAGGNLIQPRLREYPMHGEGESHAQLFVSACFDKYQWVEYSQERDAMFCFTWRHFASSAYGNADDAFTKTGFRRWKKREMEKMG